MRTGLLALALLVSFTTGCSGTQPTQPATPEFASGDVPPPNDRLFEQTQRDIRITTAVPSVSETRELFGVNLYLNNVQPVWVQIENLSDTPMILFPVGIDRAYYTPLETASRLFPWNWIIDRSAGDNFSNRKIQLMIEARSTQSGYVFTRVDEGTKSFNVDVFSLGSKAPYRQTFFVPVPGLRIDHYDVELASLYDDSMIRDVDLDELIAELESLPCCVKDRKGKNDGDPLNIAFVGQVEDLYYTLLRAGWDETETIYGGSLFRTGISALFGKAYRYSPVSALYVYDRAQDAAFQRSRTSINERNHLRIWLAPLRFEGQPVWVGQISRDIGIRFTAKTITTHKIDPDVDETRDFLIEDLAYAQGLAGLGYVGGIRPAPFDTPHENLTGDPYFTDGLRAVMWLSAEPVSISEIELVDLGALPWDVSPR